jgi:hypothetical protein
VRSGINELSSSVATGRKTSDGGVGILFDAAAVAQLAARPDSHRVLLLLLSLFSSSHEAVPVGPFRPLCIPHP